MLIILIADSISLGETHRSGLPLLFQGMFTRFIKGRNRTRTVGSDLIRSSIPVSYNLFLPDIFPEADLHIPVKRAGKVSKGQATMKIGDILYRPFLMLAFILLSAESIANDSSGLVVSSRGEVSVISNGESRPLKQGQFIYEHDKITVSNRSFAILQFVDNAKVTLRPDTVLIIEQYSTETATLNLVSGSFGVIAGAIARNEYENYRIRTPSAVLGISDREGSLTLCGDVICDQQGLVEILE